MTAAADLFEYRDAATTWAQNYLWPVVKAEIESLGLADRRAFDLGCGNGSLARMLQAQSFRVSGVDPSNSGIAMARAALPEFRFEVGSSEDDLKARFGTFPVSRSSSTAIRRIDSPQPASIYSATGAR